MSAALSEAGERYRCTVGERVSYLWSFWRGHKLQLLAILALTLLNACVMVGPPAVIGAITAVLEGPAPGSGAAPPSAAERHAELERLVLLLIALAAAQFLTYSVLQYLRARMNGQLEMRFRRRAFEALQLRSPRFFGRYRTGDLVTRLTDDISEKLSWFSSSGILRTIEASTKIVIGVIAMFAFAPALALYALIPLPIAAGLFLVSKRLMVKRFESRQQMISGSGDVVEAGLTGIRVVKASGHAASLEADFAASVAARREAEVTAVKGEVVLHAMWGQAWQVARLCTLLAGGLLVIRGEIPLSQVIGMTAYVAVLIWPMFDFGQFLIAALRASVSIDRLRELEATPPEIRQPAEPRRIERPTGTLLVERVGLTLTGREVLRDVSFHLEGGQRLAVVGEVGAGKSALLRLVPRLLDPDAGRLLLDGVPLTELDLDQLRALVGYVSQEAVLFSGTVESNVRAGRAQVTAEDLAWAARVARLEPDLAQLADGWSTRVGVGGITLSGGQAQRVSLARALVGKPRLLVLDDCTAALDATTEAALWDALEHALPGASVLLSTHRSKTLAGVDHVVVLEQGQVVEQGRHPELLAAGGVYARLYRRRQLLEELGGGGP